MPVPSIGHAVHYVARGSADGAFPPVCRAADITEVGAWVTHRSVAVHGGENAGAPPMRTLTQHWDGTACGLKVHNPSGTFFHPAAMGGCVYDEGHDDIDRAEPHQHRLCDGRYHAPGSWHWAAPVPDDETGSG